MASILECILGGTLLLLGLWGLAAPPVLVLFDPNVELSILWSVLGALAIFLSLVGEEALRVFWMRTAGLFFLLLSIIGFSIDGSVFGLFGNTPPLNLLHLMWALGFFWEGFVSDALARAPLKRPTTLEE